MVKVFSVLGLMVLVGTATAKPVIPEASYDYFAGQWLQPFRCAVAGVMTPEDAALAQELVSNRMSVYEYDYATFRRAVALRERAPEQVSTSRCVELSMNAASARRLMAQNQADIAASNMALQQFVQATRVTNTVCNKVGDQILCTTR
jgi:hypothetical protein